MAGNWETYVYKCGGISVDLIIFPNCLSICSYFSFIAQTLILISNPILFPVNHHTLPVSLSPDKCFRESSTGPNTNFELHPL